MSNGAHPSVERIAEAAGGALSAADAMEVNAHVAQCPACTGARDSLEDVSHILAEAVDEDPPMPAEIAAEIDRALRAEAVRAAPTRTGSARTMRWLGGAAAAVVVAGLAVAGLRALPTQSSSDNSGGQVASAHDRDSASEQFDAGSAQEGTAGAAKRRP